MSDGGGFGPGSTCGEPLTIKPPAALIALISGDGPDAGAWNTGADLNGLVQIPRLDQDEG